MTTRCEYLPGTIGAELHCAHWHAADDAEFAGDRASAECCWCGDHEDGSGSCPGPDGQHNLLRCVASTDHHPTGDEMFELIYGCDCPKPYDECTHEEPLLQVVERLEAENKRLGQLVAQHAARADYWTAQTRKAQEALAKGSTVDPRRCPASGTSAGVSSRRVGPDRIICPTCGRIVSSHRITGTIAWHNQDARR